MKKIRFPYWNTSLEILALGVIKLFVLLMFTHTVLAQTPPQIYHKIIATKGQPVKIIKTFDDNIVLLWLKDTLVSYDTMYPGRQVLYLTKLNTKDTSIVWTQRVMLNDNATGRIFIDNTQSNLFETQQQTLLIFGQYNDSTFKKQSYILFEYTREGKFSAKNIFTFPKLRISGGVTSCVFDNDKIIFCTGAYSIVGIYNYLISINRKSNEYKIIDSIPPSTSNNYYNFLLSNSPLGVVYIKNNTLKTTLYNIDGGDDIKPIKQINISIKRPNSSSIVLRTFSNVLNGSNILLTSDSLYLTNSDFTIINRFSLSNYLETGFQGQSISDIKFLSDGSIMFTGIITALFDYGAYLTKINCQGNKLFRQSWDNEVPYYNAGFIEDIDGGIINFVARGNDGSPQPNLMWIEKRNPNGLLEKWTLPVIEQHEININVLPNPARNYTIINLSESFSGKMVVYNLMGQIKFQKSIVQECEVYLNTKDFENGVYLVKLYGDKQNTKATKLIIQ